MIDQATELRKLSCNHTHPVIEKTRAAHLVVVSGGKGGVGTTTIAVNLAVALAADLLEEIKTIFDAANLFGTLPLA